MDLDRATYVQMTSSTRVHFSPINALLSGGVAVTPQRDTAASLCLSLSLTHGLCARARVKTTRATSEPHRSIIEFINHRSGVSDSRNKSTVLSLKQSGLWTRITHGDSK
ncbi:unnamed protein product, partial [Musa acuminata subsp. burmannicoides]